MSLPTRRAHELEACPEERRWLVEGLWADRAVGIVGGEPKCCKSFLALDLAVSVASGTPCLRRFRTVQTGPVLLFAAEDALHTVRRRLEGITRASGVSFESLDLHVITAPVVRLDLEDDCRKLLATVRAIGPKLLVLDPFVRLHRIDENVSADVAPLLAFLRHLERECATAVVLVHHSRKGASHVRAGQALRGSSELHAWGDSNLYLRRANDALVLSVEHRAARSVPDIALELRESGEALALEIVDRSVEEKPADILSPVDLILEALREAARPLTLNQLRKACRIRTARLCEALADLVDQGKVLKAGNAYRIAA